MVEKTESYNGFVIAWEEPALLSGKWTASVGSDDRRRFTMLGGRAPNIEGQTREDMLTKARQYIDDILVAHRQASASPVTTAKYVEPSKWYVAVDCAKCGEGIALAEVPSPDETATVQFRKMGDVKCPHCGHVDMYAPALMSRRQGPASAA